MNRGNGAPGKEDARAPERERERERERSREIAGARVPTADGRNIDPALGRIAGTGGGQLVARPVAAYPLATAMDQLPAEAPREAPRAPAPSTTYYEMPVLKRPVWKGYIPAYFYAGGLAGGAAVLAAAAQLGGAPMRRLVRRGRWIAAISCAASASLLIADLGRPSRFLNMMRVFRPTSPMNLGTWIISVTGSASGVAALLAGPRRATSVASGASNVAGDILGALAGVAGLPLSGYTAVLLANTAVPLWQGTRRTLPFLFVASAAASTAAMLDLFPATRRERRALAVLGAVAKTAELAAMAAVTREASARGASVARPLHVGPSALLWRASAAAAVASLTLSLRPRARRAVRVAAGLLGTAAAVGIRFAIAAAGAASTRDPRATFEPQRAGTAGGGGPPAEAPLSETAPARV